MSLNQTDQISSPPVSTRPKALLLSAYDALSHRYWRELLVTELTEFSWTVLTLPDRNFYWRIRSNALTFTTEQADELSTEYDLIVATSMVDLCNLRGLNPALAQIPTILYFHENQFDYPLTGRDKNIVNAQLTSVYSSLCADVLLFNSEYNRRTFFLGARKLLGRMPDRVDCTFLEKLETVSLVLPVPLQNPEPYVTPAKLREGTSGVPLHILWNHRWEYDKQPEVFFEVMERLEAEGLTFRLHVAGQSFRQVPECFNHAENRFAHCIESWGYQPRERYLSILKKADIVVSTARHDFQGLSVLEAMQHGCLPLVPDALAYPEYVPDEFRYQALTDDTLCAGQMTTSLCEKLGSLLKAEPSDSIDHASITSIARRYEASTLIPRYRDNLMSLIRQNSS